MPIHPAPTTTTPERRGGRRRVATCLVLVTAFLVSALAVFAPPADAATAFVITDAGDWILNGDDGDEDISIHQVGPDHYSILVQTDGRRFNYDVPASERDIRINLRGGDDRIAFNLTTLHVPRNLVVNFGDGTNSISGSSDLTVGGDVRFYDGAGDANLSIHVSEVLGDVLISLGAGNNTFYSSSNQFGGDVRIRTSPTGQLELGSMWDTIDGDLNVRSGSSDDIVKLAEASVSGKTVISTRDGQDEVTVQAANTFDGLVSIRSGPGNDDVQVHGNSFADRFVFSGAGGDDILNIAASSFEGSVLLNGGSETDRLGGEANTFAFDPEVLNFELGT